VIAQPGQLLSWTHPNALTRHMRAALMASRPAAQGHSVFAVIYHDPWTEEGSLLKTPDQLTDVETHAVQVALGMRPREIGFGMLPHRPHVRTQSGAQLERLSSGDLQLH
jgi:hypothetical protein